MCLSLTAQRWGYKCVLPHLAFYVATGDQTRALTLGAASTVPVELCPQPHPDFKKVYIYLVR